jgi:hypothetical protein
MLSTAIKKIAAAISPVIANRHLPVWIGVDASVRRDSTALVACTWDAAAGKVRLITHRIFHPTPGDELNFEEAIEGTLLDWQRRYSIREVRYDPFAMQASAQRLVARRVPMIEWQQSPQNLTAASTALYELIINRNLIAYPDPEIRLALQRAVATESVRGWKIDKAKPSHQIDVVVALAMAAHGALQEATAGPSLIRWQDIEREVDVDEKWFMAVTALLVVDNRTGGIGVVYLAAAHPQMALPITIVDFDEPPMTPDFFHAIALRLDEIAERCRAKRSGGPPAVALVVPQWFHEQAEMAILQVFAKRGAERREIGCHALEDVIDPALLTNGGQLHVLASLHFHAKQVTFSAAARSRAATLPVGVTGAFNGTHDPVTAALLLGVISQFHDAPRRRPRVWG